MSNRQFVEQLFNLTNEKFTLEGTASIFKVKVKDRSSFKKSVYSILDTQNVKYEDVKDTKSSFNVTKLNTPNNKPITIVYKNEKGGGSGAGADITALAESAQCWYTAVAFTYGKIESFDEFEKHVKKPLISSIVDTSNTLKEVLEKLTDDWVDSSIKVANAMYMYTHFASKMKSYRYHRDSKTVEKISKMFLSANNKDKRFANINKWTPADIWLLTNKAESEIDKAPVDQTWASLNKLITDLYDSKEGIGVSLKKVESDKPKLEIFNYGDKKNEVEFKSFKVSEKSKDGYIMFSYASDPNMSIQLRSFSDTGSWQGEIKGKFANGGKIGGGQIAEILRRISGKSLSSLNAKVITQKVQKNDPVIGKSINTFAKDIGVNIPLDFILFQKNDWKYSKFLTLELFSTLKSIPKEHKEKFLREVVGYASSATETSAVFIKIS